MDSYYVCCGYDLHLDRSVVAFSIYVRYCGTACVYFSFRWGPFVHSLGIVQWNSTRRDHPGNPGRVSGSGPVNKSAISTSMCISLLYEFMKISDICYCIFVAVICLL